MTSCADAGLLEAEDERHLEYALFGNWVFLTHDHDFLALDARGAPHAGIAYCRQGKYSVRQFLQMLLLLHRCYTADEVRGRVEFL